MDEQHLRVKIGEHEFEATGPAEVVAAQFQAWKEIISDLPAGAPEAKPNAHDGLKPPGTIPPDPEDGTLPNIFAQDRRGLISLKVHPSGDKKVADGILLLLWASRRKGQEEQMVGKIKEALNVSGLKVDRVDRAIAPYQTAGFVLKGGSGKGGRYRLTNPGIQRAEELIQQLSS